MNYIRRTLALLLAMALALSLAACSNKPTMTADFVDDTNTAETSMAEPAGDVSAEPAPEADTSAAPEEEAPADASAAPEETEADTSAKPAEEEPPAEADASQPEEDPEAIPEEWDEATRFEYTLCFSGDINLAEGQHTTNALDNKGLDNCVSETLRKYMTGADVMCVNNEFTYTTSKKVLKDKTYTFKANPSRVKVMQELGADIAILANNHVFDFTEQGLTDTLTTLQDAGIATIGAGNNLKEASAIHYVELEHCTVAYIAATRVEWSAQTQPATKKRMGVFYTANDTDLLCKRVAEAKENADYVVVCMHWGTEGTSELEGYQTSVGDLLIESGADIVVGDHPHQLQGVKFVEDKPVFYSLGNYWFSRKEEYTMLLNVLVAGDKYGVRQARYQVIPAQQLSSARVIWLDGSEEQKAMFKYLTSLPGSNIRINKNGFVTKKD